jgi:transcription elongation GreA/GreB family factor
MSNISDKEKELIDAVATARAHGDLSENAEYHAAREALALFRSKKDADEKAAKDAERKQKKLLEERENAIQEMLETGMSLDEIQATMPWLFEKK